MKRRTRLALVGAAIAAVIAVPLAFGAVTATGIVQHGDKVFHGPRLFRDGIPSDCHGKANPGAIGNTALLNYDKYSFRNTATTSKCAHVFINRHVQPGPARTGERAVRLDRPEPELSR